MADNPPAFPCAIPELHVMAESGMSLRDYFAVHADQPGVTEIVSMAGGETDGFWVALFPGGARVRFNDWWSDLPLSDRLDLSARVRYAMADAMLAARQLQSEGR